MQSRMETPAANAPTSERAFACAVFAACLVTKLGVLLLDDRVRVFMGDSATYLWSAVALHIPPD